MPMVTGDRLPALVLCGRCEGTDHAVARSPLYDLAKPGRTLVGRCFPAGAEAGSSLK